MPKYEFAVYNNKVREAVKVGESVPGFEDSWADIHYIEAAGPVVDMARATIDRQYPARQGFVVDHFSEVEPDD